MPQTQTETEPYHIRNADTVIREFVNTELNNVETFTDDGEPIIEVEGEPLTRKHIDEALTTALNNTPDAETTTQHFTAVIERRLGETQLTQHRVFTLSENTAIDPLTAVKTYYEEFWGSETERSQFNEDTYTRPDGGEAVRVLNVNKISPREYEALSNHISEIPQVWGDDKEHQRTE